MIYSREGWGGLGLSLVLLLAGCAGKTPAPVIVKVPVPVRCTVDIGPEPVYPDSKDALRASANIAGRVDLLLAGAIMRQKRLDELNAALTACLTAPVPTS